MMQMSGGYRFLEHISDVYVEAWGGSLEEAFENAAKAMFDTMTELNKIEEKIEEKISAEGEEEQELLYSWLENLLIKYEVEGLVFSRFKVSEIREKNGCLKLQALAYGEKLNLDKHPSKVEIKAVTYHMMEIKRENGRIVLRVLFDI
jgi:SHS2 domain-containing protein